LHSTNENEFIEMIKSKEDRRFLHIFQLRISDSEFKLGDCILDALSNGIFI
jgi:hypothetical protein